MTHTKNGVRSSFPPAFGSWLESLLSYTETRPDFLAVLLGVKPPAVYSWMGGRSFPTPQHYDALQRIALQAGQPQFSWGAPLRYHHPKPETVRDAREAVKHLDLPFWPDVYRRVGTLGRQAAILCGIGAKRYVQHGHGVRWPVLVATQYLAALVVRLAEELVGPGHGVRREAKRLRWRELFLSWSDAQGLMEGPPLTIGADWSHWYVGQVWAGWPGFEGYPRGRKYMATSVEAREGIEHCLADAEEHALESVYALRAAQDEAIQAGVGVYTLARLGQILEKAVAAHEGFSAEIASVSQVVRAG